MVVIRIKTADDFHPLFPVFKLVTRNATNKQKRDVFYNPALVCLLIQIFGSIQVFGQQSKVKIM